VVVLDHDDDEDDDAEVDGGSRNNTFGRILPEKYPKKKR
jgi:hypothetical protein